MRQNYNIRAMKVHLLNNQQFASLSNGMFVSHLETTVGVSIVTCPFAGAPRSDLLVECGKRHSSQRDLDGCLFGCEWRTGPFADFEKDRIDRMIWVVVSYTFIGLE